MRGAQLGTTRALPGALGGAVAAVALVAVVAGAPAALGAVGAWGIAGAWGRVILGKPRSAAGFVGGIAVGWSVMGIALVVLGGLGVAVHPGWWLLLPAPVAALAVGVRARRGDASAAPSAAFDRRDSVALLLTVIAVLALLLPAWLGVGRIVEGAHRYAAFFGADLFKHAAYTNALAQGDVPPFDPFTRGVRLGYYWLAYLVPAVVVRLAGPSVRAIDVLVAQSVLQTVALVIVLYGLCRRVGARPPAALLSVVLGVLSPSLDGLTALWLSRDVKLSFAAQALNIESLDFTLLLGARDHVAASTLFRLCTYVPQHQLAFLLLLSWVHHQLEHEGGRRSALSHSLLVALPSVSLLMFPAAALGVLALAGAVWLTSPQTERKAVLPVGLELLATLALAALVAHFAGLPGRSAGARYFEASEGSGVGGRLAWLPAQLLASYGVVAVLGALGLWMLLAERGRSPWSRFGPGGLAAGGLVTWLASELLLPGGDLRVNVELKASFVLAAAFVVAGAVCIERLLEGWGRRLRAPLLGLLVLGLPTVAWDLVWHSTFIWDERARRGSSVSVPVDDMAALDWARAHTPAPARFVQKPEPSLLEGGPDTWVPVFAGRAVSAAPRATRWDAAEEALSTAAARSRDPLETRRLMQKLGADYLYLSGTLDPGAYSGVLAGLAGNRAGLKNVYQAPRVSIWQLEE